MSKMRGTDLIARMIAEMRTSAKRAGREVSQENLDQLAAIHRKLKQGHDTVEEAMRELASFVAEKDPGDGTDDPPSSSDGFVDNLPAAEAGIDTADARSRLAARGATRQRTMRRLPVRLFTRPDLYTVRGSSRTRCPR